MTHLADVNVRALTKFTNFNHSSSPNPLYRGWVTDGDFRMEAEMPFVPSFQLGDEFKIVKAMPHVSGELVLSHYEEGVSEYGARGQKFVDGKSRFHFKRIFFVRCN